LIRFCSGHTHKTASQQLFAGINCAIFLTTLGVGVFAFAFPLIAKEHNIAGTWLGAAFSGYFFAKLILAPLAGVWADKKGARQLLMSASLLGCLLPAAYALHPTLLSLYIIQFGLGLVAGIIKPVGTAIIGAQSLNTQVGSNFGRTHGCFYAALMLSPLAGGVLFQHYQLEAILWCLEACLLASFLIIFLCLPKSTPLLKVNAESSIDDQRAQSVIDLWLLISAVMGRTAGIAVTLSFWPLLLANKLHLDSIHIGTLVAIPGIITCVGLPFAGQLADRWDKRLITFAGMFVCAAALFYMPFMPDTTGILSLAILMGLGSLLSIPASLSLASQLSHRQGRVMGLFHGASNAGFIIGPAIGGWVSGAWGLSGAFMLVGIVGMSASIPIGIRYLQGISPSTTFQLKLATTATALIVLSAVSLKLLYPAEIGARESYRFADVAMGTIVRLNLLAPDKTTADRSAEKAFALLKKLEEDFDHRSDGSIARINAMAGIQPVKVSSEAYRLIERALRYARQTRGLFDVTIGAVSVEDGYYAASIQPKAAELVDYRFVRLDPATRTVFLPVQGMALDMDGMAKGTIIDEVTAVLKQEGIKAGIVEAGGDFYCFGDKNWNVGIQHPRQQRLLDIVQVRNMGVCGSGDYYQFIIEDNEDPQPLHHHILHPLTMLSARKSIGITVLADSAEQADVLATALFIMGPDEGKVFLKENYPHVAALWIQPDLSLSQTENFTPYILN
jgi:thiamine biosynthesis lipoprotein